MKRDDFESLCRGLAEAEAYLDGAREFPVTKVNEVFGSLNRGGKAKTIEEMDAAVAVEARRRASGAE